LPHYLAGKDKHFDYYNDYEGAVTYLTQQRTPGIAPYILQPISADIPAFEAINAVFIGQQNDRFAAAASKAVDDAVSSIGDLDPLAWVGWWAALVTTTVGAASCFITGFAAIPIFAIVETGAAATAAATKPTSPSSFKDAVKTNIGNKDDANIETNWHRVDEIKTITANSLTKAAQQNKWTNNRAQLEMLRAVFDPAFIRLSGGGSPEVDLDAVKAKVTRDLLLKAATGTGQVIYNYTVTNAVHEWLGYKGDMWVYNPPADWTCTLDSTILGVPPQMVTPLSAQFNKEGISVADLQTPKVQTPKKVTLKVVAFDPASGELDTEWFVLDGKAELKSSSFPEGAKVHLPYNASDTLESPNSFVTQIQFNMWRDNQGQPPNAQVDKVDSLY